MELYLALAIPILIGTAWLFTASITRTTLPTLQGKRICLLIAHPDDEAMFFSPTIAALTAPELGNHVKILCLSSGNADGLGETRKKELAISAGTLGLRRADDVLVLEDAAFPDSMVQAWPTEKIADVLSRAFILPPEATGKPSRAAQAPPETTVDVLITFDKGGVSAHPNHASLFHGARAWIARLMKGKEGWRCPVELFTLTSVSLWRKYLSFIDAPITLVVGALRGIGRSPKAKQQHASDLLFISGIQEYRKGQVAMTQGHKSQMRWFRWGWIGIGRYMIVNDLKREKV